MLKLYKKFRPIDWILTFLIIGLTIVQVWCTMLLVDYVQDITKSIIYLNYQNQISSMLPPGMSIGDISFAQILQMMTQNPGSMDSSKLTAGMWTSIQTATTGNIWYNGGMMVLVATGAAKTIRITKRFAIWTCCISLVARVTNEAVENLLISAKEKLEIFVFTSVRSVVAKLDDI